MYPAKNVLKLASLCFGFVTLFASVTFAQYSATSYGAVGDGQTDDTAALQRAINSVPSGSVLDFGGSDKVYLISARLTLQPNRTYQGRATLLMSSRAPAHTAIAKLHYGYSDNVTISGLTFDANGIGGCLHLAVDGQGALPANNVQIVNNTFRNTSLTPAGAWDGAIYSPVGLINSNITGNRIINGGNSMYLVNPNQLTIADNEFYTIRYSDAIYIMFSPAPFAYGQGINISRNRGQHLGRMAIELWPNGGNVAQTSQVQGVVISNNTFSDWDSGYDPEPFGISVMAGQQTTIVGNILRGGVGGTGIELGSPQSLVEQNTIEGFPVGISLLDCRASTLRSNLLTQQSVIAINLENTPGSRDGLTITNNRIINPKIHGILINTQDWGGSTITSNTIWRAGGAYPEDQGLVFTGIGITPPTRPVTVSGNSVVQSATDPPVTFGFIGIRVNGGPGTNANSTYSNNSVLSRFKGGQSVGLLGNSPGTLDDTVVQSNTFQGLSSASGGSFSSRMQGSGNLTYDCVQVGPIPVNR